VFPACEKPPTTIRTRGIERGSTEMTSAGTLIRIRNILQMIYSRETATTLFAHLEKMMDAHGNSAAIRQRREKYGEGVALDEKDSILITYADTVFKEGEAPLHTLHHFLRTYVKDIITGVHILPFFPSSSDGGFAVMDYKEVDPQYGAWRHIHKIAEDYHLMMDLVLNHVSSKSKWFQNFLEGNKRYRDYFIWSDREIDMPEVFRPRESPLSTRFDTGFGTKYVWTTFSPDQIDLNYRNPEVLLRIIDILLFYLSQGAEIIRLDAVGYLWKEAHTSCINLSKTHQIVRLFRYILQYTAPYAILVTEANFPFKENIAYFGEGDEAHMVYQFSLPPLVLDAFARKDASHISTLTRRTRPDLVFFDFLASHDGIGLPGAKGILSRNELENLLRLTDAHGGLVSYEVKNGEKIPYELNITYFDAINDPKRPGDPLAVQRFMASQEIMLALKGVPGIYIHSLLGSGNDLEGVNETGIKRKINRKKLHLEGLAASLGEISSTPRQVLEQFLRLLDARKGIRAFHPAGIRKVLELDKRLIAIERRFEKEKIVAIINVSDDTIPLPEFALKFDLITRTLFSGQVEPYGVYTLE
jgi:glucosylglycerate phosphorylase